MTSNDERMQILEMLESGAISAAEAARLLEAITGESAESSAAPALPGEFEAGEGQPGESFAEDQTGSPENPLPEVEERSAGFDPQMAHWRNWWIIPLWIGAGITVLGAGLMYLALRSGGLGFWFGCAWLPLLLGLAVMALAGWSSQARWLHLRVHQKPGERPQTIAISFPLPLRLTAWVLRVFRPRIPRFENTSLDEIILALGENTSPERPFYVEVDEGDGEKVQVYIG